ncbi:hypothetical protein QFC20_007377 [Naganishia adeliensis]|uniref:Uncharacterized protein n=1 Tax=Naganishia adeliensis TaxID=92952 RepID=A0ACC2UZN6_9TREE|nr:hypothetical protein QFC20_007377 [Naganishia adeliensis]
MTTLTWIYGPYTAGTTLSYVTAFFQVNPETSVDAEPVYDALPQGQVASAYPDIADAETTTNVHVVDSCNSVTRDFFGGLAPEAPESTSPGKTRSYTSTAVTDMSKPKQKLPFTAKERRQRNAAVQKAARASKKAEQLALFGNEKLTDFWPRSSGEGYELRLLGKSAREMIQGACDYLAPSAKAGAGLQCRLTRLVRYLELYYCGRLLAAEKSILSLRKFRLKEGLALLIVKGCPTAYLDPGLTPLPDEYCKPMLEKLEALEEEVVTKLEFTESEEQKESMA